MHACGFDTISNILTDVENLLKWLQNCMHASGFDIISNILANAENLVKIFDTPEGLISSGKMGTGKPAKKPDKGKAAMEEACMRERVREIPKNLSSMLRALGELAIPNPNFRQSRLSSLVPHSLSLPRHCSLRLRSLCTVQPDLLPSEPFASSFLCEHPIWCCIRKNPCREIDYFKCICSKFGG